MRLLSKSVQSREQDTERITHEVVVGGAGASRAGHVFATSNPTTVEEVPIERDTFVLTYECQKCHHKWTESITEVKHG